MSSDGDDRAEPGWRSARRPTSSGPTVAPPPAQERGRCSAAPCTRAARAAPRLKTNLHRRQPPIEQQHEPAAEQAADDERRRRARRRSGRTRAGCRRARTSGRRGGSEGAPRTVRRRRRPIAIAHHGRCGCASGGRPCTGPAYNAAAAAITATLKPQTGCSRAGSSDRSRQARRGLGLGFGGGLRGHPSKRRRRLAGSPSHKHRRGRRKVERRGVRRATRRRSAPAPLRRARRTGVRLLLTLDHGPANPCRFARFAGKTLRVRGRFRPPRCAILLCTIFDAPARARLRGTGASQRHRRIVDERRWRHRAP